MATATFSGNGNYYIDVDAAVTSQNIAGNYSTVYYRVYVVKTSGSGFWSGASGANTAYARFTGTGGYLEVWNASGFAYDFRNGSNSGSFLWTEGTVNIAHNADGTGSYDFASEIRLDGLGTATAGTGSRGLPRIPRGPRVKTGGTWRNTICYVKVGGTWRIALPYVKTGGTWRLGGN